MTVPYRIEENADGSAIVHLARPVIFQNEPITRLTIERVTGRHMKHATWSYGQSPTVGQIVAFTSHIVKPEGILDELDAGLARDISVEVVMLLGKSQTTGAPPSPT